MNDISTKHLHWQKLPRSLFAEISELPGKQIPIKPMSLDPRSIDGVLTVVSHHTGAKLDFYLEEEVRSKDNEIIVWNFLPLDDNSPVTKVMIFND